MEKGNVWEEIEVYLGIFMTFYGTHIDGVKLKEERQKQGKTLPFDDNTFVNSLSQRSFDSYPRIERDFLDHLVSSLNRLLSPPTAQEVREELTEIVRAKYSGNFEATITSGNAHEIDASEVSVRSGDYLLNGGLDKLLDKVEYRDGMYCLKE